MRIPLILTMVASLAALPASAAELAGVVMPDSEEVNGTQLVLNGMGLREKFFIDVYVAGLYLEARSTDAGAILAADGIKRLRMHFVYKEVDADALNEAWIEGLEKNAADSEALAGPLSTLTGMMVDVKAGDELVFTQVPGAGLEVDVRGTVSTIDDEAFATAFWSIFLGPKPPTGKLKKGLLGG